MAKTEALNPSSSPELDLGGTREELKRLHDIIDRDNIRFSEKKGKPTQKEEKFDRQADTLFDQCITKKRSQVKDIINGSSTPQEKQNSIQALFRDFLNNIDREYPDIPSLQSSDYNLYKALTDFKEALQSLKEEEIAKKEAVIDLTTLELTILEDAILQPIGGSTTITTTPYENPSSTKTATTNYQKNPTYDPTISPTSSISTTKEGHGVFDKIFKKHKKDKTSSDPDLYTTDHIKSNNSVDQTTETLDDGYSSANNIIDSYDDPTQSLSYDDISIRDINRKNGITKDIKDICTTYGTKDDTNINRRALDINWSKDGMDGIITAFKTNQTKINKYFTYKIDDEGYLVVTGRKYAGAKQPEKDTPEPITKQDIKVLIDNGVISYETGSILRTIISANQLGKIANILSTVSWQGLQAIATAVESRTDYYKGIKSLRNEVLTVESLDKDGANVFMYLCDYNSDTQLSNQTIKDEKILHREGDVGNIFGQQIYHSIMQAIDLKNIELGGNSGEQMVIFNIIKTMKLGQGNMSKQVVLALDYIYNHPNKCTKANLVLLLQGKFSAIDSSLQDGVASGFKTSFIAAMEKVCGGNDATTPDLYHLLTGTISEEMINNTETHERNLRNAFNTSLDKILRSNDPKYADIKNFLKDNSIEVREQFLTKIMNVLDNMYLATSSNSNGVIDQAGISKDFALQKAKKLFVDNIVSNFINLGIYSNFDFSGGNIVVHVPLSYGKQSAEGGDVLWRWNAGPGIVIGKDGLSISLGVGGEIEWQFNKNQVINANLDKVVSANYAGVEGRAIVSQWGIETAVGADLVRDPLAGINQIDKQYTEISKRIFDISKLNFSDSTTAYDIYNNLLTNIKKYENNSTYGAFVQENYDHLVNDARFISRLLEEEGILANEDFKKLTVDQRKIALNDLITILHGGIREQWRGDLLLNLGKHVDITKVSFGLTTRPFLLGNKEHSSSQSSNNVDPGTGIHSTGNATDNTNITTGGNNDSNNSTITSQPNSNSTGERRFGIGGIYVGLRLSTWENTYIPNAKKILFTNYRIGEGKGDIVVLKDNSFETYANYLQKLFHKDGLTITPVYPNSSSKDKATLKITGPQDISLSQILNIYYRPGSEQNFFFDASNNTLIIGNVGEIGAYTTLYANGVDRVLCLGSKSLKDTKRLEISFEETSFGKKDPAPIEKTTDKLIPFTGTKLTALITSLDTKVAETEKKLFSNLFDTEGKLVAAPANVTYDGCTQGDQFTTGTLSLLHKIDGRYTLRYSNTPPKNSLELHYQKETSSSTDRTTIAGTEKTFGNEKTSIDVGDTNKDIYDLFNPKDKYEKLLNDLKNIEKKGNKKEGKATDQFIEFMKNVTGNNTTRAIDYSAAIKNLQQIIPETTYLEFHKIFKEVLKDKDNQRRIYIIGKFEAIFAHEEKYNERSLKTIHGTGEEFLSLTGPSGKSIPENTKTEIKNIKQHLPDKTFKTVITEPSTNIFGYSAFYRTGVSNNYGITTLGDTMVCKDYIYPLKETTSTKEWIINNIKANYSHLQNLVESIRKQFTGYENIITVTTLPILLEKGELTQQDLTSLNITGIDISNKKLILNSEPIFYFMGECFNESIGIKINSVEVQSNITTTDTDYTQEQTPDKQPGLAITTDTYTVSSTIGKTVRQDVSYTHYQNTPKKAEKPNENPNVDPGTGKTDDANSQNPDPAKQNPSGGGTIDNTPINTGNGGDNG